MNRLRQFPRQITVLIAAFSLALVALSGCSPTDAAPAPSPTEDTTTVQEVASVVARYQTELLQLADDGDDCATLMVVAGSALGAAFRTQAETCWDDVETELADTADLASGLGAVLETAPDEIADLTTETWAAAGLISGGKITTECPDHTQVTDACASAIGYHFSGLEALAKSLHAWSPYL